MPLVETLPVGADTAQWEVWGTVARIVVTEPAALADATAIVRAELAAVDLACSRFRPDSELNAVCRSGGRTVTVSPLLADLVAAALDAARQTGGDVDPTVGGALCNLGYDRDFAALTGREVARSVRVFPSPDWTAVRLEGDQLTVPAGVLLDLGATAKAVAADRAAALVALRLGTGVLVALGGDIATAGPAPQLGEYSDLGQIDDAQPANQSPADLQAAVHPLAGQVRADRRAASQPAAGQPAGGWRILVQDRPGDPACVIRLPAGAALATSSTASRVWGRPGELVHHIIDPRTGRSAPRVWRTVSVAAFSCLRANILSTAAVIRGHDAPMLLAGAPARLVTPDLDVLRLGGWPA